MILLIGVLLLATAFLRYFSQRIQYLGKEDQLLIKQLTKKVVVNGPCVCCPNPLTTLSFKRQKALCLTSTEYATVRDDSTGQRKVVTGPSMYFLGAYEVLEGGDAKGLKPVRVLKSTEGLVVSDEASGKQRVIKGPCTFVPQPTDHVKVTVTAVYLKRTEYVKIENTLTGKVWVEAGEQLLFCEPHWRQLGNPQAAYSLKSHQYVHLEDQLTGAVRTERGPQLVFPSAFEHPTAVMDAIDLNAWQYCKIQNRSNGEVRIERGPKLVWLSPQERVLGQEKEAGITIDIETAALVKNLHTGVQTLLQTPQLFVPSKDEEVLEMRKLIRLANNEAIVLKDQEGAYHFYYGDPLKGTERSLFLPPYWEHVTLLWSRGRRRERRDLKITVFDTRPQYMSFEFNCRTSDNVEMILEGTFFWEVVSLPDMLANTGDAPGDVCAHARSCFIQLVSKVTLQEFMAKFNEIAYNAHSNDDSFYTKRGIKIHSLEVTRYQCAEQSTARILEQIITETTNRMNRLSCQESENEVAIAKLKGSVEQENAKSEVLAIQQKHLIETARAEGLAEAERCTAFLKAVRESADSDVASSADLPEQLWHTLRRKDALEAVSSGSAHVYFTPQDANLTIENRNSVS